MGKRSISSLLIFGSFSLLFLFEFMKCWNSPSPESRDGGGLIRFGRKDNANERNMTTTETTVPSVFDKAIKTTYSRDICNNKISQKRSNIGNVTFELVTWDQQTKGGLADEDRVMLGRIYAQADSVFEWGLGESSYIAGYLGVPRYAGVDSDAAWVSAARDKCPSHFRFSFADVGPTQRWGKPVENLPKRIYDYVIAPLSAEHCAFDVYMVDGRYREACALMALLHSSQLRSKEDDMAIILIHDYTGRRKYHKTMEQVCDVVELSGATLVALKRKPNVTDQMIYDLYWDQSQSKNR